MMSSSQPVSLTTWISMFKQTGFWNGAFPLLHCVKSIRMWSLFWSVHSCIWTKYGYLQSKYLYSVWMREIWARKSSAFGHFSRSTINSYNTKYFWPTNVTPWYNLNLPTGIFLKSNLNICFTKLSLNLNVWIHNWVGKISKWTYYYFYIDLKL